jgi:predicted AAA+ superfamily ATPase
MTRYQCEEPVSPDFSQPWIQRRLEQLEGHFHDFLTSREGRFYVLFGGRRAGKTSLLKTLHHQFPPEPGGKPLSVLGDSQTTGHLLH